MTGSETHTHWPAKASRARARARDFPASAPGLESFLEWLALQTAPPANFRPAARRRPARWGRGMLGSTNRCAEVVGVGGAKRFERSPAPSELIPGTELCEESTVHGR